MTETLRDVIRNAYADNMLQYTEVQIDAIHDAVQKYITTELPVAVEQALKDPKAVESIAAAIVVPMLQEIEDIINDDHDDPKTPDAYRPGLRRAARTIREARRAAGDAK